MKDKKDKDGESCESKKGMCCPTMHCPFTGINICRFLITVLAGFVFVFGYDYVLHTKLLMSTYEQTPQIWRTPEDMQAHFFWIIKTQLLTVLVTAFIFTRNFEQKGIMEGVRFGAMIGVLMGVLMGAPYAWLPITKELALAWEAGGLVQGLGLGVIYALLYRK